MINKIKRFFKRIGDRSLIRDFARFRSTIYWRVVFIIASSLIVLFIVFNIVMHFFLGDMIDFTFVATIWHEQLMSFLTPLLGQET